MIEAFYREGLWRSHVVAIHCSHVHWRWGGRTELDLCWVVVITVETSMFEPVAIEGDAEIAIEKQPLLLNAVFYVLQPWCGILA